MPIFEYRCDYCKNVFDDFLHTWRNQETVCPECKRLVTDKDRVMSMSNFNAIDLRCQRMFGHDLKGRWTSEKHKAEANH